MIRQADKRDIPHIASLFAESIPGAWSAKALEKTLSDKAMRLWVYTEAEILGAILVQTCMEEAEILLLATEREHRRRGIARTLLQHAADTLPPGTDIFLEVRGQNTEAILFYTAFGFVPFSVRKNYYRHPTDDAVCMKFGKI